MKKYLVLTLLFASLFSNSFSQDNERKFQKFKGLISLGYAAFPGNSDIKSGFIFSLEPKYGIMDQLYVGARVELNILAKELKNSNGTSDGDVKVKVYESFVATADYYFTKDFKVRPFVSLGGGAYYVASANTQYDYNTSDGTNATIKFGGLARVGVDLRHFNIAVEYNLVPKSKATYTAYNSSTGNYVDVTEISKNSYIGIKAGYFFGGGNRK